MLYESEIQQTFFFFFFLLHACAYYRNHRPSTEQFLYLVKFILLHLHGCLLYGSVEFRGWSLIHMQWRNSLSPALQTMAWLLFLKIKENRLAAKTIKIWFKRLFYYSRLHGVMWLPKVLWFRCHAINLGNIMPEWTKMPRQKITFYWM